MRGFLWNQGELKQAGKESLWVRWIHSYKLKAQSFWEVPCRDNISWSWRKLLQASQLVCSQFWFRIGNGKLIQAWHDNWAMGCPLGSFVSPRDITRAGFSLNAKLADVCHNLRWNWSVEWSTKFLFPSPTVFDDSSPDILLWKYRDGSLKDFSVRVVWDDLRQRSSSVDWFDLVWFSHRILKHAFHLWLVCNQKLKTQDRLRSWDVHASSLVLQVCPFRETEPDSYKHLFFQWRQKFIILHQIGILFWELSVGVENAGHSQALCLVLF
uniref:uncharacterized protein LOC122610307 n=1 Tax=Erigeron canadensis TaxID=72917 RepID=UPI001CB966A8|nr:uncharacterized protein LOC122610307 [Erigeron canadensis]